MTDKTKSKGAGAETAPRRKRLSSDERREEFLAKAIEFFAKQGFESSTRALARQLGVTQPLLYRYFPSKSDLISEVYDRVYVKRWRDEWSALLTDREKPVRSRLVEFYSAYTDVVFHDEWMRIFLFSGLKGEDINRRYMKLVRARILEPILREHRVETGMGETEPSDEEVEFAWIMHGGIFYYGVRTLIYEASVLNNKDFVIETSIDAFLGQLPKVRAAVAD
ncbi:Nucleoid occlusion factor SlmA [Roseivivax sp. THAF40]|uniref:TetR/AcrR family transcriptional regulator n=1 Tax=unclassified Roseivivax TaxID=2639302 RepID=UPI0012688048|nr:MULTISPECIES: TetR/AcrR family transcriptional regulator [unclassified Roseivivax]QFS82816.1 Nucleoid occlusion factor SlmA [Roseivivax sp. THAF197b]QFT46585.1 Nucleoid occlusion factor SlmA [Roseivivax sp. THAF40]